MSIHLRTGVLCAVVALASTAISAGLVHGQGIGPAEAVNDSAVALQDTMLTVAAPGVLSNDQVLSSEPGAPSYDVCTEAPGFEGDYRSLPPRIVSAPGKGTLTISVDGSYRFVPVPGFVGTVAFPYSLANIDELPQCPINTRLNATLTIEVIAPRSFDGTFTPVSAQTGPCILVDATTIAFGDVPTGSTAWAAPSGAQTTTLSSCSPTDQAVVGVVSTALGAGPGALSLEPTADPVPLISQFSYGVAARPATAARPAAPASVLTTVPVGITSLQRTAGVLSIEHYLIGPAVGTPGAGNGFRFTVTLVATVRA
jgi:hypothetical protein